jgi:hypothetical protein
MIMTAIQLKPIGIIHSPFKHVRGMPIQPSSAEGIEGWVEIFAPYTAGLQDLDGFSHIILLYHFHEVKETRLVVCDKHRQFYYSFLEPHLLVYCYSSFHCIYLTDELNYPERAKGTRLR